MGNDDDIELVFESEFMEVEAEAGKDGNGIGNGIVPAGVPSGNDLLKEEKHRERGTCKDASIWLREPDEPDMPLVGGLIERGEMVAVVGQSKAGKSFLALQMAVCIAMGLPFLERPTIQQKVYIANLEVSRKQYKKRLRKICTALGISPESLEGKLFVDNMKGESASWEWCRDEARMHGCSVVLIDPFYQIFKGDESDVQACQTAIDEMKVFQKEGMTLIVVFHSPKGFAGDRQLIDMISGSSMLARFPESIVGMLNHALDKQCRVIKCILRNYAPPDDQTVRFDEGIFRVFDDLTPDVETTISRQRAQKAGPKKEQEDMSEAEIIQIAKSMVEWIRDNRAVRRWEVCDSSTHGLVSDAFVGLGLNRKKRRAGGYYLLQHIKDFHMTETPRGIGFAEGLRVLYNQLAQEHVINKMKRKNAANAACTATGNLEKLPTVEEILNMEKQKHEPIASAIEPVENQYPF